HARVPQRVQPALGHSRRTSLLVGEGRRETGQINVAHLPSTVVTVPPVELSYTQDRNLLRILPACSGSPQARRTRTRTPDPRPETALGTGRGRAAGWRPRSGP